MSRNTATRTWDQIFAELNFHTSSMGSWSIQWNEHRAVYETVERQWQDDLFDFESPLEAARCLRENTLVVLHWYKDTPVGSYKIAAPDMEGLRRMASRLIDEISQQLPPVTGPATW
jgi:hypothetical protein